MSDETVPTPVSGSAPDVVPATAPDAGFAGATVAPPGVSSAPVAEAAPSAENFAAPQSQPQAVYEPQPQAEAYNASQSQAQANYGYNQSSYTPANAGYNLPYTGIGSAQKDKWVAAILAFFLGTLGIHKFYLGYKNEGIIMLVVAIVGSCCFGIGALVMAVISIVEAVRYLILTQEDFQEQYVVGRKGWF